MIFLWIFLGFITLVLFLLYSNVHIVFRYRESPEIYVRFLLFKIRAERFFRFFSKDDKKKASTKKREQKQKGDIPGFIKFLGHISWVIKETILDYFSISKVYLKELRLSIGTDDAARTAIYYGTAIQAANGLCALLQNFSSFRWKDENLSITPNFSDGETKFSVHLVLSIKVIRLITLYFRTSYRFFEGKDFNYESDPIKASNRSVSGKS